MSIKDRTLVAFDGRRRVAVARKTRGGWLVVGYGVSWLEAKGKTNCLGISNPTMLVVPSKTAAKALIDSTHTGE